MPPSRASIVRAISMTLAIESAVMRRGPAKTWISSSTITLLLPRAPDSFAAGDSRKGRARLAAGPWAMGSAVKPRERICDFFVPG